MRYLPADVAKLLLDSGSEPNLQNLKGNTALHEAAQQESVEVMQDVNFRIVR
ncbi:hypothetical protein T484DRAFT_1869167 [Baffinella frigidus]|nr:hypothetical protein T484DRAFT_1869167 [Cryptophyta sp. CCMP2293]